MDEVAPDGGWVFPYHKQAFCAVVTCPNAPPPGGAGPDLALPFLMPVDQPLVIGQPLTKRLTPALSIVLSPNAGVNWTESWLTLAFAPGTRIETQGRFDAGALTFTAANAAQGWDGVRFLAGSSGAWTGTTVELVAGGASVYPGFGSTVNAFVGVADSSPTFTSVTLRLPVGSLPVDGFYVTDTAAPVNTVVITTPVISNLTGSGVVANGAGRVDLFRGDISGSAGAGVTAGGTGATAYLRRATTGDGRGPQIFSNASGVVAASGSVVRFGEPGASPGYGYASVRINTGRGLTATGGGVINAGSGTVAAGTYQRNQVLGNWTASSTGNALATGTGSAVYARCNWWGQNVTAPFRTGQASGGLLDASYYLTADPYTTTNPLCAAVTLIGPERGVAGGGQRASALGRGTAENEAAALDRLAEAMSEETPAEAVGLLAALVADLPQTEAAAAALGVAGVIAGRTGAPPAAAALLSAAALGEHGALRIAAWQGLVASRRATGDAPGALAAADALAAEGGAGAVPAEVARVYLHAEAGDTAAALAALSSLGTLAPASVEVDLARAFLGGDGPAAGRGVAAPAAEARGAAEAAAEAPTEAAGAVALAVGPNPAGSSAAVTLTLVEASQVVVTVYDLLGRAVAVPLQGGLAAGAHRAALDVSGLAPGVYVVRAVANTASGPVVQTARLTVTR